MATTGMRRRRPRRIEASTAGNSGALRRRRNIVISVGQDGVLMVDSGTADRTDAVRLRSVGAAADRRAK
jgi:hypothetical protein